MILLDSWTKKVYSVVNESMGFGIRKSGVDTSTMIPYTPPEQVIYPHKHQFFICKIKYCLLLRAIARVKWENPLNTVPLPALVEKKELTITILSALLIKFKIFCDCKGNDTLSTKSLIWTLLEKCQQCKDLAFHSPGFCFVIITILTKMQKWEKGRLDKLHQCCQAWPPSSSALHDYI